MKFRERRRTRVSKALFVLLLMAPGLAAVPQTAGGPHAGQRTVPPQSIDPPVSSFGINQTSAYPIGVTTDASGNVWFAEDNLDALAEYVPSNSTLRTYAIPTPHHLAWIWFMVFDGSGNLWFADESQQLLWSFNPATDAFLNFTAGTAYPMVLHLDQGRGRMWFTSLITGQVGYFDISGGSATLGKTVSISAPLPGAGVSGIAVDSAGDVFVAESFQAKIVELDGNTLSVVKTWTLPQGSQPVGLALDPVRGRLWFTNHASSFFGYVDLVSDGFVEYSTSLYFTGGAYAVTLPYWIFVSSSGNIWFNEHIANRIGRFDPGSLQLTEFDIPTNSSSPLMLALDDPHGLVWFTEFAGNSLGEVEENSSLGLAVSNTPSAIVAGPSAALTTTSSPGSGSPPTLSITSGSTGEPQPGFEVSITAQGSSYKIGVTAYEAAPGEYTGAVCFEYLYVNQCGYVPVSVPPHGSLLLYSIYAAAGVGVAAFVVVLLMEMRRDRRRPRVAIERLAIAQPAAPATTATTPAGTRIQAG